MRILSLFSRKHDNKAYGSGNDPYKQGPFFYDTSTNNTENPQIEMCWNYGWPPYTDYIYIHDIYYRINGITSYHVKCSECDIGKLLKDCFSSNRKICPNIEGYYIYDWLFNHDPELWKSLGFSEEPIYQESAGFIHVADY